MRSSIKKALRTEYEHVCVPQLLYTSHSSHFELHMLFTLTFHSGFTPLCFFPCPSLAFFDRGLFCYSRFKLNEKKRGDACVDACVVV